MSRPYKGTGIGQPGVPRPRTPLLDRIAQKVAMVDSGCVVWLGSINAYGYGQVAVGNRLDGDHSVRQVHRVLYETVVGPVPEGLDLDHLCRNRACCRPERLEPVSRAESIRRGVEARRAEAVPS